MEKKAWYSRILPAHGFFAALLCAGGLAVSYYLTRFIESFLPIHYLDISTSLDHIIPLAPAWIYIYVICYPLWALSLFFICRNPDREKVFRSAGAILLGLLSAGVIFLLLPTTLDRPAAPDGGGLTGFLVRFIYNSDEPTHLFPSLHCFNSYICWRALHGRQDTPRVLRVTDFVLLPFIFASVLFTRQHLIWDIPGGVILAELCWQMAQRTRLYRVLERPYLALAKVFSKKEGDDSHA